MVYSVLWAIQDSRRLYPPKSEAQAGGRFGVKGFVGFKFKGLGLRALGFRGLGSGGLGFRGLGLSFYVSGLRVLPQNPRVALWCCQAIVVQRLL